MTIIRPFLRRHQALALEPRILLDAAAVTTAADVAQQVAPTDSTPGVEATPVAATVTITDDTDSFPAVDLFSGVSVSNDNGGEGLESLVVTVDSTGSNQALLIDGSTITLEATSAAGTTATNGYSYTVEVSGGTTTITLAISSSEADGASNVASLIDGIAYQAQDNSVESGTVTVSLSTLSDSSNTVALDISATIAIENNISAAPTLSDDHALESAESFTVDDLGNDLEVAYSSDGDYAYVAGAGAISVYAVDDSGRLSLNSTLTVEGMGSASEMVISSDGSSIYVIDGSSNIHVFAIGEDGTPSYTGTASSGYGNITGGLAVSDDGAYVYVGTQYDDIVVLSRDADTGELAVVSKAAGSGSNSRNGIITLSGGYAYVLYGTTLTAYQVGSDGLFATLESLTVSGGSANSRLLVSDDGEVLYVTTSSGIVTYAVDDDGTLALVESISVADVSEIALSSDGNLLYAISGDGAIIVYAISGSGNLTLISSIEGASGASDIAVSSDGLSLLVAGGGSLTRYTLAQTLDQGSSAAFASGMTVADGNFDTLDGGAGNYKGASITVSASVEGSTFGFADGNGLTYESGTIYLDDGAIATLSASDDGVLTVTFTADTTTAVANQVLQQLTYANDSAAVGTYIVLSAVVSDGALTSNTQSVTLRINAVPQLNTDAATGYTLGRTTSETAYTFTLFSGLFSDADGDPLTWSVSGLPDGLTFDAGSRTISGSTTETGTFSVSVTVTDGSGATATLTLELVVDQVANRAPEVGGETSTTLDHATEGTDYSVILDSSLFSDADSVYGDSLSWSVSGLPDGLSFDAETLTLSGTAGTAGDYTVTVTATDESGASASVELTLRVITQEEASNSAPSFSADADTVVYSSDGTLSGYSGYVNSITLSDDGTLLVIAGSTGTSVVGGNSSQGDNTLSVYSRDASTGELTLIQTYVQGTADDGDDANGIEVDGLNAITSISFSADGSYLFVAGYDSSGSTTSYTVVTFSVNDDGSLALVGSIDDVAQKIVEISASSDGSQLFVLSTTTLYNYTIGSDGSLTLKQSLVPTYSGGFNAVAKDMAVTSDGTVYAISNGRMAIFTYDAETGELSYRGTLQNSGGIVYRQYDSDGNLSNVSVASISTFGTTYSLTASDDGYIYVTTYNNFSVLVFQYDADSNSVTLVQTVTTSGSYPTSVALSADGTALYVGSGFSSDVNVYSIGDDGTLTLVQTVSTGTSRVYRILATEDGQILVGNNVSGGSTGLGIVSASSAVNGSYTELGTITPASAISFADADYDALADGAGNYNGATLTIAREGGADTADSYGFADGNGLTLADGVIYLDGSAIATFASTDGTLAVAFTADVSTAIANRVLQQITYSNTSSDPGSSITLVISVGDAYTSGSMSVLLAVAEINDAPTLEAGTIAATYVAGASGGVRLFDGTAISTVESGQAVASLTLSVGGVLDGESETLTIDGTAIALVAGSGTTTHGYSYAVTVSDGIVTVTLAASTGIEADAANALVDAITYANASDDPTDGTRTVTLAAIEDNGGTGNGGVASTTLDISATVVMSDRNSAPTLASTPASATYTENAAAVALFSGTSVSTVEAGQSITSLTLTVSGVSDGESETLSIDGTAIALVEGSGSTASGYAYTVAVSGGTVTVQISSSAGIEAGDLAALVDAIAYANASEDPSAGSRTVTLAAIEDNGGSANGGSDSARPAIAATVGVVAVNDAPVLASTAASAVYATSGSSASLFSGTSVDTVESGQAISAISVAVSGLLDGRSETLVIDGTSIALVAGSGSTDSGYGYTVTVDAGTGVATVTISSSEGIASADAAALIDGISYVNLSSTYSAGERSFSLSVQDSGGSADGGADTTTLASSATLSVEENSAPVLGSTPDNETLEIVESLPAISGLSDVAASALSSDGSYLYAVSSDGAIAIFSRNASTGELAWLETLASGLDDAGDIQISADGSTLYVLGDDGDAIAIFSRSGGDGSLAPSQTLATENVAAFAVAEDGSAIYVVDGNYSGLKVYSLDSDSGEYALSQTITASTSSEPYLFTGIGIEVVGDYVYVITNPASSALADTLIVYQRNSDGTLGTAAYLRDGDGASLADPLAISVSSDGGTIYVASADSVSIFSFDADSGTLAYAGAISGLSGVTAIALASDDDSLYIVSSGGTISRYDVSGDGAVLLQTLSSSSLSGAQDLSVAGNGTLAVAGASGLVSLQDGLVASLGLAYAEQGTLLIASALTLADADYDALADGAGNYNGATLGVSRSDGTGSSSDDSYGFADGNGLTLADGVIYLDGSAIATFASTDGTLAIAFTADVSTAVANRVLQQITYSNTSDDPGSSIGLLLSVSDGYGVSDSVELALAVTEVNDAPTLSSSGASASHTEGGAAVGGLFSGTAVSTVEAGQSISLLTLTVSGVSDGASETLTLDGTAIALVAGSGSTSSGYSYTVAVDAGTGLVTVTLGSSDGIAASAAAALVDAIAYANASDDPTEGERSIALASVSDDGGTTDGGSDTATLAISASVTVVAVNDAPTLASTGAAAGYTEGGAAAALFSGTTLSTVEAGQSISTLTLTVSGVSDGASETLTLDGTAIALVAGSGSTSSGYGYTVTVSDGSVTVTLSSASGIATGAAAALIDGIAYANASSDPTEGSRTVTLSAIQDDGGSANGGTDTASLSIAATVTVASVNQAPTLAASAAATSYSASGEAASLFGDTVIATGEDGQSIVALTLQVSGVADSAEQLLIDGALITLADGASATTSSGLAISVSMADGVATLEISSASGLSVADTQALINAIAYQNASASVSTGERIITLASVQDSGGTDHGGADTTALAISATVTVVNSAPQASDAAYSLASTTQGDGYSVTLPSDLFTDADGDSLSWQLDGLPEGLSFDAGTLTISGSTRVAAGSYALTLTATDPSGATASRTLTLTVSESIPHALLPGWDAGFPGPALAGLAGAAHDLPAPAWSAPLAAVGLAQAAFAPSAPRAASPDFSTASGLLDALLPPAWTEAAREPAQVLFADGRSSPLATLAASDAPVLEARQAAVAGRWVYDPAGNRMVFKLPDGLVASRSAIAALELRLADGRALPPGVRLDLASGQVVAAGARAGALELQLLVRTSDGQSLSIPVRIDAAGPARPSPSPSPASPLADGGGDRATLAAKPALSEQLRQGPASDLLAQARALLAQLAEPAEAAPGARAGDESSRSSTSAS